ncbi:MAG: riboflavin synthase [Methyloligellaceae bacterium]
MFTGLISDVGTLYSVSGGRMRIESHYDIETIALGASIACDGCCLTAIKMEKTDRGTCIFDVDVSNETLECTTLGTWQAGRKINLERSLTAGDELGGHIVSGHVDALARITEIRLDGESKRFTFEIPDNLKHFVAPKGSVALNGTSLTVNEVNDRTFGINLIPHTMEVTTWGERVAEDYVNFEVDLLARYVSRMQDVKSQ